MNITNGFDNDLYSYLYLSIYLLKLSCWFCFKQWYCIWFFWL